MKGYRAKPVQGGQSLGQSLVEVLSQGSHHSTLNSEDGNTCDVSSITEAHERLSAQGF